MDGIRGKNIKKGKEVGGLCERKLLNDKDEMTMEKYKIKTNSKGRNMYV